MTDLFTSGDSPSTKGNGRFLHWEGHEGEATGRDERTDGRNPGIGRAESLVAYGAAIGATFLVRRMLHLSWQVALDRDPPKNPGSHAVAWKEALLWGAVSGAIVGMARIGSRRASTAAYRRYWQSDRRK